MRKSHSSNGWLSNSTATNLQRNKKPFIAPNPLPDSTRLDSTRLDPVCAAAAVSLWPPTVRRQRR